MFTFMFSIIMYVFYNYYHIFFKFSLAALPENLLLVFFYSEVGGVPCDFLPRISVVWLKNTSLGGEWMTM